MLSAEAAVEGEGWTHFPATRGAGKQDVYFCLGSPLYMTRSLTETTEQVYTVSQFFAIGCVS